MWDVTTPPLEGYPYGFFQRWTITMDGDCAVTITPEDRAYGGPMIGDTPGTGDATDGSLLASWSYRVSTYCCVASRLDASVVGNTFTGTISTLECLGGSDYPVTGVRH